MAKEVISKQFFDLISHLCLKVVFIHTVTKETTYKTRPCQGRQAQGINNTDASDKVEDTLEQEINESLLLKLLDPVTCLTFLTVYIVLWNTSQLTPI